MRELKRLSIILTEGCNKSCKFCFQRNNKAKSFINLNKIDGVIDEINSIFKGTIKEGIELTIIGGEPLLFNKYKELYDVVISISKKLKIRNIKFFSNLTLENDEMLMFIKDISELINTSIISTINISDTIKNRLSTDEEIVFEKNIKKIKEYKCDIVFNKIFDLKKISEEQLTSILENKNKADSYFFQPSTEEDIYSKHELNNIFKKILKFSIETNMNFLDICESIGLVFNNLFKQEEICVTKCQPFYSEVAIYGDGRILSCSLMLNHKNIFENLSNKEILEMFSERPKEITESGEDCKKCLIRSVCHRCKITPIKNTFSDKTFKYSDKLCEYEKNKAYLFLEYYSLYLKFKGGLICSEDLISTYIPKENAI